VFINTVYYYRVPDYFISDNERDGIENATHNTFILKNSFLRLFSSFNSSHSPLLKPVFKTFPTFLASSLCFNPQYTILPNLFNRPIILLFSFLLCFTLTTNLTLKKILQNQLYREQLRTNSTPWSRPLSLFHFLLSFPFRSLFNYEFEFLILTAEKLCF
jgi:hypothetical protein